jgi:hypothetical protein
MERGRNVQFGIAGKSTVRDRRAGRRQLAVLRAALIEIDGQMHFCRIINVSAGGFELKLYRSTKTGGRVRIHFANASSIGGTVAWCRGNATGIKLDQKLDTAAFTLNSRLDPRSRRRMPRTIIETRGTLQIGHVGYQAHLLDISPVGARVRTIKPLDFPGPATLRLPKLPLLPSRICWLDEKDAGLTFNVPIEMRTLEDWLESGRAQGGK